MEIYILDALNRRQYCIDQFISFIWTERWNVYGDFQIVLPSSYAARSLLTPDTWLIKSGSNYVGRVESVDDSTDDSGIKTLTVKGRMLEAIMDGRAALMSLTDPPADVARAFFNEVCVAGSFDVGDIIPGLVLGTFMPASTIAEPADDITISLTTITTLFDAVATQICVPWDLGFRILRQDSTGQLYFDIYAGSDRTTDQETLPAVVFSPNLDNLEDTSEITDITTAKNVAYVHDSTGVTTSVYASDVDPTVAGFERRVLVVDATDIVTPTLALITQRGQLALSAARTNYTFDGTISQNCQYTYGTDYNLGDLVEMQNQDGVVSYMRVTEQIFTSDDSGEFSYPTLVNYNTINAGTWASWNNSKTWSDLETDPTTWSEEP
jgi:hypothetical protein